MADSIGFPKLAYILLDIEIGLVTVLLSLSRETIVSCTLMYSAVEIKS